MMSESLVKKLSLNFFILGIFLLGLLVVPFTPDFVGLSKVYIALFLATIIMFLYGLQVVVSRKIEWVRSPLTWPLVIFGLVVALSTFLTASYPVEGLLGMGGIYLGFVVVALMGGSLLPKRSRYDQVLWSLMILGAVLTLSSLTSFFGFGPEVALNYLFKLDLPTKSLAFNLAGSTLVALQIVLLGLVAAVIELKRGLMKKESRTSAFSVMFLAVLILGLSLYVWALLPGKETSFVSQPVMAGWSVALDVMRVPKSALLGVGPEGYINAYQRFKPLWMNGQPQWAVAYIQSTIPLFTVLTNFGILGVVTWLLLLVKGVKLALKPKSGNRELAWLVGFGFVLMFFFPLNAVVLMLIGLLIAVFTASQRSASNTLMLEPLIVFSKDQRFLSKKNWPKIAVGGGVMVLAGVLFYLLTQSYLAFYFIYQSQKAVAANDGVKAYRSVVKAIKLNPYLDVFRRQLALLDVTLASTLANKADLTDNDQQQIAQLLQEAANEAKAASVLDPLDWRNWQVLAQVYQSMIGVAKDADQWAVQAYIQAIRNNPLNPDLRIALGGIFFAQKDFVQAANVFQQAVNVKPDLPNGYYNLANALKEAGQLEQAKQAYEALLKLLKPETEDYIKASKELKEVEAQLERAKAQSNQAQVGQPSGGLEQNEATDSATILNQELNQATSRQNKL